LQFYLAVKSENKNIAVKYLPIEPSFFTRNLAFSTALPYLFNGQKYNSHQDRPALLKPARLNRGYLVALITARIPECRIEKAVKNLEELGLRVATGKMLVPNTVCGGYRRSAPGRFARSICQS